MQTIHAVYKDRFKQKVMIITGSATGIGRASALRAAQEGARLVLVDKKRVELEETCDKCRNLGAEVLCLTMDISIEEYAKQMVEMSVEHFGKLDIALNNAGVMGLPSPVHQITKEQVDFTMQHNFYSVLFCAKYEIQQFLKQGTGGVIVNNASIAGLTGLPGNPAYVASKHAVNGLTRNLALDYAKANIRINSINPAGTNTPMVEEALAYVKKRLKDAGTQPTDAMSMAGDKTQGIQHRNAEAYEQAASMLYLASDDATHITGTLFATDGGWTAF